MQREVTDSEWMQSCRADFCLSAYFPPLFFSFLFVSILFFLFFSFLFSFVCKTTSFLIKNKKELTKKYAVTSQ